MKHEPVLFNEILESLIPSRTDGTIVDATLGLGGHAEGVLERHPSVRLIGIDRDPEALERSRQRLARILRDYGEEPMARRIARAIVAARSEAPIETTSRLAEIIRGVKRPRFGDIDPSTLTFQALRIATNEELTGLDRFLDDAVSVLESGARIAIISFHSLEDRIVKRAFRRLEGECTCPRNLPVCGCGAKEIVNVLTHRPVTASEEEIARNPRSRSAKLRVAEKL